MIARTRGWRGSEAERGSALVELAVVLPVLILIMVGTIDFARVFYMGNTLTNAARAGAQFGTRESAAYTDDAGMQAAALGVTNTNLSGAAAVIASSHVCECMLDTGTPGTPAVSADCTTCTTGHVVISVTVSATKTFSLLGGVPGLPGILTLTRSATLRAQ